MIKKYFSLSTGRKVGYQFLAFIFLLCFSISFIIRARARPEPDFFKPGLARARDTKPGPARAQQKHGPARARQKPVLIRPYSPQLIFI